MPEEFVGSACGKASRNPIPIEAPNDSSGLDRSLDEQVKLRTAELISQMYRRVNREPPIADEEGSPIAAQI